MSVTWQKRTHGVQRRQEAFDRALARVFLGGVIVITLLGSLYLALVATNTRLSGKVWQMEEGIAEWQRQNEALTVEIARLSSIPVLIQRSIALGYAPAANVHYLVLPEP
ncbi:MAG: hypothetical protein BWY63_02497 [Chloroflexi bacterium ADurb.Bin360]|nr:MAG: hypothetical protein BWY63_02497 [Chloroflexi bacterium ADurb.Bin360]